MSFKPIGKCCLFEHDYPSAAECLREGVDETLTVMRLRVPGLLKLTLKSTNPMESAFNGTARHTRNLKRWRNGGMVRRWMAVALLEVDKEIPALIKASFEVV